jgi:predicted enzyme related to lactoylglutathione lyase
LTTGSTFRYVELPATSVTRAQKFYKDVFGWEFLPPPDQAVKGDDTVYLEHVEPEIGISTRIRPAGAAGLRPSVLVDSIEEILKVVEKAGGTAIQHSEDMGDGYGGVFEDTEGNHIFLWEFK